MIKKIDKLIQRYGIGGIKKSLHLAVSQSFIAGLFILIDFIFSKQLSVAEFGVWKELFFIFNLGIPLLAFGLPEGFKYFIAKNLDFGLYFRNLVSLLLVVSALLIVIILLFHVLHWFDILDMGIYYGYSFFFPLPLMAFLMNKAMRYSFINLDKNAQLTQLSFYGMLGSFFIIVIGAYFVNDSHDFIVLTAITIYTMVFLLPTILYFKALPETRFIYGINRITAKQMLSYGLPLYFATFAGLLSVYLDKLIVNIYTDDVTFAIFAVGAFEIPIFAMLSAAFSQQIFPKMVMNIERDREDLAKNLWLETTKKVSLISYPAILLAMFFAEEIIFFVYSENYKASIILFKTYLLVALFRNNSYGILLTAKGNTKLIAKISITILIINTIFSVLLFYYFGLNGVVFGTLISTFLFTTYVLYKEEMILGYIKNVLFSKIIAALIILILLIYFLF